VLVSGIKPSFNNWFLIISKKNVGKQNVVGHEDHTNYLLGKNLFFFKFYLRSRKGFLHVLNAFTTTCRVSFCNYQFQYLVQSNIHVSCNGFYSPNRSSVLLKSAVKK